MPAKKGKDRLDPDKTPRKRMSSGVLDVAWGGIEVDEATGVLTKTEEKIFNPESKRWVSLESLTGKTLMVDILRNEVSDLRTQLDISKFNIDDILQEKNALQREVELLRIAVKDADKQDNEIHILEETIVEKDKKIAELLNSQVAIADTSLLADFVDGAGVDPNTPSSSGLSPKFDSLSFREKEETDDSD